MRSSELNNPQYDQDLAESVEVQLGLLRDGLASGGYSSYPPYRLKIKMRHFLRTRDERLRIPYGPWGTADGALPSDDAKADFLARGLELDSQGRPLHPWFEQMVEDEDIGILTGRGYYRQWGPNPTADPIVVKNGHILLIQRANGGEWGLPGGHVDPGEDAYTAALREAWEETSLVMPDDCVVKEIYSGPVADVRLTAHAWPETTAYVFDLGQGNLPEVSVQNPKEIKAVEWVPIEIATETSLYGSHKYLLDRAINIF